MAGVTDREERVAEVTVRVALPDVPPYVAVIVVVPGAISVARPLLFIVATAVSDELQLTAMLISWVVPFENKAVAVNYRAVAGGLLG